MDASTLRLVEVADWGAMGVQIAPESHKRWAHGVTASYDEGRVLTE